MCLSEGKIPIRLGTFNVVCNFKFGFMNLGNIIKQNLYYARQSIKRTCFRWRDTRLAALAKLKQDVKNK